MAEESVAKYGLSKGTYRIKTELGAYHPYRAYLQRRGRFGGWNECYMSVIGTGSTREAAEADLRNELLIGKPSYKEL